MSKPKINEIPAAPEEVYEVPAAEPAAKGVVNVTMEDGRVVSFAGKKRLAKFAHIDEHGHVTTRFDFRNGRSISFHIPQSLMAKFAAHGAEQKIGDVTAGEDNIDDAVLAVEKVISQLEKGEWAAPRAAGGMAGTSLLLRALVELSGKSVEDMKAFLLNKTHAEKIALRGNPRISPIIARLEAEKPKKESAIDTDKLLDGVL